MPKDCVLNELSFRDLPGGVQSRADLLIRLVNVARLFGQDVAFWACVRHDDKATRAGIGFDACRSAVCGLPRSEDRVRRVLSFLLRVRRFGPSADQHARHHLGPARGLGRAHELAAVALSLDVEPWRRPMVAIEVDRLVRGDVETSSAEVRNATLQEHIQTHLPWSALTDSDRLRVLLQVVGVQHKAASEYKKHVRGTTNAERLRSAVQPTAPGQYFAEAGGTPVTDATIASWEREVLDRIRDGDLDHVFIVRRSLTEYHVYCDVGHAVGYASRGVVTSSIRVEWKDGQVHSHPREAHGL